MEIEVNPEFKLVNLKKDIEYSADSIVSKTILERDSGTVTLFSFDEGQNLSEHTAPFDSILQVLEGEAQVIIGGKITSVEENELIIMPADVPHSVKAIRKFKMLLIMIC